MDFFQRIGHALKTAVDGIANFVNGHPVIKNTVTGTIRAAEVAAVTYIANAVIPGHEAAITSAGMTAAVVAGVKAYAQVKIETVIKELKK